MTGDPRAALRRDRQSATGLSLVEGDPVRSVEDLPEHLVAIHTFENAQVAGAFVEGLRYASANGIAVTWEPGRKLGNCCVLVARLFEDRPAGATVAEAVPVHAHPRNDWDSRDFAASMQEIHEEDTARRQAHRERMAPLRAALTAGGVRVVDGALDWVRAGDGGLVIRMRAADRYEVEFSLDLHRRDDDGVLMERYAEAVAAHGFHLDPLDPRDLRIETASTPEGAVEIGKRMETAAAALPEIAKTYWHERFMETMRVTPRIRTFLKAGAEEGIQVWYERRNLQAKAGGVHLKVADVSRLRQAGWLEAEGHFPREITVTAAGLAAAGGADRPVDEPSAAPTFR